MEDYIKILGAFGGKSKDRCTTCIQVDKDNKILIDAGEILNSLGDKASQVEHIFVTHSHLDHILEIPLLIDMTFATRKNPLKIYASKGTIRHLIMHILNWDIWPDFSEIDMLDSDEKSVQFVEIIENQTIEVEGYKIKAIANNHTNSSFGYVVSKEDKSILFTSDTYCCDTIWDEVNLNKNIKSVIIDVSFPSQFKQLAFDSKHLTPQLLKEELKKLNRNDVKIYIYHLKPAYENDIINELNILDEENNIFNGGGILSDKMEIKL
jgi:ribonuclease BN (tRNA processing enzyme)